MRMFWDDLHVRALLLGLLVTVAALLFVLSSIMDHEQFVKEYRSGHGLSVGKVLVALGIGFGLWHLFRAIEHGSVIGSDPHQRPTSPASPS